MHTVCKVSAFEGLKLTPWGNTEQLFGGRVKNCVVQLARQFNHCSLCYCGRREITSCRREAATHIPRPWTLHAAAQLQPIHALRLATGAQRALLPVAVGATNIHDVRNRRQTDVRQHHCLMPPPMGRGHNNGFRQLQLHFLECHV